MKGQQFKSWIFELRKILTEIKNSHYFLDAWTQFNSAGSFIHIFSTKNYPTFTPIHMVQQAIDYFTINGVVLFEIVVPIYRITS
ncbi:Protein Ycf2 [Bienertia sinuspersici]